jgi:hypothetical protein
MKNSICRDGSFHDYQIFKQFKDGVVEICSKCHDRKYFRNSIPNRIYLSYHLRSALQKYEPRFKKEYQHL